MLILLKQIEITLKLKINLFLFQINVLFYKNEKSWKFFTNRIQNRLQGIKIENFGIKNISLFKLKNSFNTKFSFS